MERATAAGGGLVPIADEPEGVGATGAPEAAAVVGITLFFPLGVDTTMGWDGDGCVEAMTDRWPNCSQCSCGLDFSSYTQTGIEALPDVEHCLRCLRLISR